MEWYWDPFVESLGVGARFVYPQLLWSSKEKPYELRIVNKTDKYIWIDATFWLIKFPKTVPCPLYGECDPEDLFQKYMSGVAALLIALNHVGVTKVVDLLEGKLRIELPKVIR